MVLKSWNQLRSVYSMIYNNFYSSHLTFAVLLNHQQSVHGMACSFFPRLSIKDLATQSGLFVRKGALMIAKHGRDIIRVSLLTSCYKSWVGGVAAKTAATKCLHAHIDAQLFEICLLKKKYHAHTLIKRRSNKKYHDFSPTSIFLGGFYLWFTSIEWQAFMPHSHTLDHGPQVFHEVLVPGGKMNKSCW